MAEYYRGSGYDKKFLDAKKRGATLDELNAMSVGDMRKALEKASYVVPVGAGANAIRLGYKAYKAGKKVAQFTKAADATAKANRTKAAQQLKTKGERAAENKLARDRAKVAANRAKAAKTRAAKAENKAVGAAVAGTAVGLTLKSKSKTKPNTPNTPNQRKGKEGNQGRVVLDGMKKKVI